MKKNLLKALFTSLMLLVATTAMANRKIIVNNTTTVYDGSSYNTYQGDYGSVSASVSGNTVTLTFVPNQPNETSTGYYITKDDITVVKTIDGRHAQTRNNPEINTTPLDLTPGSGNDDPSATSTYSFTMLDDANYDYEVTANFQVRTSIATATVSATDVLTYTGEGQHPSSITVTLGSTTLVLNTDYTLGFTNATSTTDEGKITATGKGKYSGEATTTFAITAKSIADGSVTIADIDDQTYTGSDIEPTVTVKDGENVLVLDKDYTVEYSNNVNAATFESQNAPTVIITGKGNYDSSTTKTKTFSIIGKSVENLTIEISNNLVYTGSAIEPTVTVKDGENNLELNKDYTVAYTNNVNVASKDAETGAPTVTITGIGNYTGTKVSHFTINQANFSSVTIEGITDYEYTGEEIEPTGYTVKLGGVVINTSEYTTSLSNNKNVGIATLTLISAGKNFVAYNANDETTYRKITFGISPATVTLTAENTETTYNSESQAYEGASVTKGELVITYYTSAEDRSGQENGTTIAPTDAGTYYVRVTLSDQGESNNYIAAPEYADATFTINPLSLEGAEITLENAVLTCTGTEQTVTISSVKVEGIEVPEASYEVSGNKGTDVQNYTLTVTAKENSNFTGSATTTWSIIQKTASLDELRVSDSQPFATYFNTNVDTYLPDGVVAYIVSGISGSSLIKTRINYIPKNVAALVEKGTSEETAGNTEGNILHGTAEELDVTTVTDGTVYVLYNNQFVKSTSGTIPANRAYLKISDNGVAQTRGFFNIKYNGGAKAKNVGGRKTTDDNDNWFDMGSHKISRPTKAGIYIHNGQKVVIK
jgi:hypothetical protein